jgi:anti-sigma-K factor RskA
MVAGLIAVTGLGVAWQLQRELDMVRSTLAAAQNEQAALANKLQSADARIASLNGQLEAAQGATVQLRAQLEASESSLRASQQQAQSAQAAIGAMQREFDVLMQPNVRLANIPASADSFKQGVATVFFAPQSRTAVLSVANLPPLKPEQTYQVWLIKGANLETRLPSVIFNTSASGSGRVVVLSNEPFENFVAFGITVEPAGGRPVPNPEGPIFVGKLG